MGHEKMLKLKEDENKLWSVIRVYKILSICSSY
jgi:hypothetical protein